jgi:hypothetical protein
MWLRKSSPDFRNTPTRSVSEQILLFHLSGMPTFERRQVARTTNGPGFLSLRIYVDMM